MVFVSTELERGWRILSKNSATLSKSNGQAAVGCPWPDPASAERTKRLPHSDAAVEHALELPLQQELLHLRSRCISFLHDSPVPFFSAGRACHLLIPLRRPSGTIMPQIVHRPAIFDDQERYPFGNVLCKQYPYPKNQGESSRPSVLLRTACLPDWEHHTFSFGAADLDGNRNVAVRQIVR